MQTQHTGAIDVKQLLPENNEKKHNTAATSREAFSDYTASGKRQSEKLLALSTIAENQPVTSRQLAQLMKVERGNVCRCLKDLEQSGKIKISHIGRCQVTHKRVFHYCLTGWQPSLFHNL